ncbi:hypothetical protein ACJX0J_007115, partial [Zea mays]
TTWTRTVVMNCAHGNLAWRSLCSLSLSTWEEEQMVDTSCNNIMYGHDIVYATYVNNAEVPFDNIFFFLNIAKKSITENAPDPLWQKLFHLVIIYKKNNMIHLGQIV